MSDIPDYPLDDTVELDTPERMKAATEPVRSLVLDLVLERAMTVSELAARIGKSKGTMAHHVDVLVDVGLLKIVRTRKVRAMEERFYGRTARTMCFPGHPSGELPFAAEAAAEADFALMERDVVPAGFTMRHARIPVARAQEWNDRIHELALEFSREERGGDTEFALYVGLFPTNRRVAPAPKQRSPRKKDALS